ncbi:MAG: hypothetical protein M6G77_00780 [Candidatus Phytoplasma vitis]|nr:MAG: hypothetical protein M6G77_00780 [Candidatus Phytoplasma vitis]
MLKLKQSLYNILNGFDKIKCKDKKTSQYSEIANYTKENQLENSIVQFGKILDLHQEFMKKIRQENLINKINFSKLSKIEEIVLKLVFQIDENNKFSRKLIPLNNQQITDFINKK